MVWSLGGELVMVRFTSLLMELRWSPSLRALSSAISMLGKWLDLEPDWATRLVVLPPSCLWFRMLCRVVLVCCVVTTLRDPHGRCISVKTCSGTFWKKTRATKKE
jgi:hypothetical protein